MNSLRFIFWNYKKCKNYIRIKKNVKNHGNKITHRKIILHNIKIATFSSDSGISGWIEAIPFPTSCCQLMNSLAFQKPISIFAKKENVRHHSTWA